MAILNKKTNKYEAKYFHKLSNAIIVGVGNTKEEAYADLKEKKKQFSLVKTKNYVTSPGMEEFENRAPTFQEVLKGDLPPEKIKIYEKERVFFTYARPDLVTFINKQRERKDSNEKG